MTDQEIWDTYKDNIIVDPYVTVSKDALYDCVHEFFQGTLQPIVKEALTDYIWTHVEEYPVPYVVAE